MSLQDFQNNLLAKLTDNVLALSDDILGIPFLRSVFQNPALAVREASVEPSETPVPADGTLTIRGVIDILDSQEVSLEISLAQTTEGELDVTLEATLPTGASLGIPGLDLDSVVLRFNKSGTGVRQLLAGSITGNTQSGPLVLSVLVPSESQANEGWVVAVRFEGDVLDRLIHWFGQLAGDVGDSLPVADLHASRSADVGITFNPVLKTISRFSLSTAAPLWRIVEGFAVQDLQVVLSVEHPQDSALRAVSTTIQASCMAGNIAVPVIFRRSGTSGEWNLRLANSTGQLQPSLSELVRAFGGADIGTALPLELAGLENLTLSDLQLIFNPATRPAARAISDFSIFIHSSWEIVPGKFAINDAYVQLDVSYPADTSSRQIGASLGGTVTVGGVAFEITAQRDKGAAGTEPWILNGGLPIGSAAKLSTLFDALALGEMTLPLEVPDVIVSGVAFSVTPQTAAFTLQGACSVGWSLPFGVNDLLVSTTEVNIERGPSIMAGGPVAKAPVKGSVRLLCKGPVLVVDGLTFNSIDLTFSYDGTGRTWQLSGTLLADLFQRTYTFKAGLLDTPEEIRFLFEEDLEGNADARPLVDLGSIGTLSGSQLAINLSKQKTSGAPGAVQVKLNATSTYSWSVSAAGQVNLLAGSFKFDGTLALHGGQNGIGLAFKPTVTTGRFAELVFPLPAAESIMAHLGFDYLDFAGTTTNSRTIWTFKAGVDVWFSGLSGNLGQLLPTSPTDNRSGLFEAGTGDGGARVAFTIEPLLKRQAFTLPSIAVADFQIDLSRAKSAIEIERLQVSWNRGGSPDISVEFGLGIAPELNDIFGKRNGKPVADLFVTYDEMKPDSLDRFRLAATSGGSGGPGIEIQLVTSPFKKLAFTPVRPGSADRQASLDLGEYGIFSIIVPSIGYAGQNFWAKGGFTQRNLALPLSPLKSMLKAMGLEPVNRFLPDRLPLEEVPIYNEQERKFNIDLLFDKFIAPLQALDVALPVEDELRKALSTFSDRAERLPERLLPFLDIKIPEQFYFDLAVSTQGGLLGSIGVTPPGVPAAESRQTAPVRFFIPGLAITGPVLNCIELWNISVGEILGGALLQVKLDLNLDQFDLLPLAAVLALPDEAAKLLPSTQHLTRRLILDNVVILVAPEALVAVPIFFNQLGFEYLGLEGLNLQAHFGFPEPSLDLKEALQIFNKIKDFFTTDALLDEGLLSGVTKNLAPDVRRKFDLALTLGPLFADLPAYLGKKSLGSPTDSYTVSLYGNLVHLLNGLKKLQVSDFIQSIPQQYRSSPQPPAPRPMVSLGPLSLYADWFVGAPPDDQQGLLLHLEGGGELAGGLASLNARVDLKASDLSGFAGSFAVSGSIGGLLELEMDCSLVVDPDRKTAVPLLQGRRELLLRGPDSRVIMPGPTWTPQAFTVEWWLYPMSLHDYNQTVAGSDVWGSFAFHTTSAGGIYAGTDTNTRFTPADLPNGTVELNTWQHFAFTFDHGKGAVYKNGRLLASRIGMANPAPWTGLCLGWTYPDSRIDGLITNVSVWDHARPAEAVGTDVFAVPTGREPGLVAFWPLDDGVGNTASDLTGHFPGTVRAGTWQLSTRSVLSGLAFNGQSDRTTMPGPLWTPAAFTVEWWIYPNSLRDFNQTIADSDVWGGFAFHTTATGGVYAGTNTDTRFTPADLPDGTVEPNKWQHFAFTYENGNAVVYKNGQSLAVKSGMASPAPWTGLRLGWTYHDSQMDGRCAEVRIWDHACIATTIRANMFRRLGANVPGLIACWPLDDGAGNIARDATGQNPGTVLGAHWVQPQLSTGAAQSPVQITGNCRLLMAGQQILTGHVRITGDSFWFQGRADLVPHNPVIQAVADVEGWLSSQEFYLSGVGNVTLGNASLVNAQVTITQNRVHMEGKWLGGTTLLDVDAPAGGGLIVQGQAAFRFGLHMDFVQHAIEKVINNRSVKLADSLHLNLDITGRLDVTIGSNGFQAVAYAQFILNGHNNKFPAFNINVPPTDVTPLLQEIKRQLTLADPTPYFEQLFANAQAWLNGIASGVIGWTRSEYTQMAVTLRNFYQQTTDDVTLLLKNARYGAAEVIQVLQGTFTQGINEGAKALAKAQYGLNDTVQAIRDAFAVGPDNVATALNYAGYGIDETAGAVKVSFNLGSNEVARALNVAGYSVYETGKSIKMLFNLGNDDVAVALKSAGYTVDQVADAIRITFNFSRDDVAKALRSAGYSGIEVGQSIKTLFNLGNNDVAKALRYAGYTADQTAEAIKTIFNFSRDNVYSALISAGFSVNDILDALKRLF